MTGIGGCDMLCHEFNASSPHTTIHCAKATLFRDPSARWFLPGDGAAETPRLQLARTYSLMAVACPSRAGGGGSRPGSLTSKEVVRMLVNSMR